MYGFVYVNLINKFSGPNEYRSGLGSELDTATSSSEDEDNQNSTRTAQKTVSRKTSSAATKKKKNTKIVKASRAEIATILLQLMEKGTDLFNIATGLN